MSGGTGTGPDVMRLATDERVDLADFLDTLAPEQWEAPSLCQGWSVRDVVAHVVSYEELGMAGLLTRRLKGVGRGGSNEVGRAEYAARSRADLTAFLRRHARPQGLTSWFGGAIALTDGLVHHQDIRRALGAPRTVPAERLLVALVSRCAHRSCRAARTPAACDSSPPTWTGRTAPGAR